MTLHQLGAIAQERRRFDEAEDWYRRSLDVDERMGNERGVASRLGQLGLLAEARGDVVEAIRQLEQAAVIFARVNDPHSLEKTRHDLQRLRAPSTPPTSTNPNA